MADKKYMVVAACNFDLDTTNEYYESLKPMNKEDSETMAKLCNKHMSGPAHDYYFKVVEEDYKLYKFEP